MKFNAKDIARIPHLEFRNGNLLKGRKISGVATDSRELRAGQIFFALRGESFDGHKFLADVFEKGASAAVVSSPEAAGTFPDKVMLVVEDTVRALGDLARMHRQRFDIPVLAIGGSNGKTTTKEMVATVLGAKHRVLNTEGNHNNYIGVPLTLLRLQKKHDIAVIEIGTNHPGEIAYLCGIVEPTHGLITNIGREHLEFFGTLDGVADEEGALFESFRHRKKGLAFVNADDERVAVKAKGIKKRITYGIAAKRPDFRGKVVGCDASGCAEIRFSGKSIKKDESVRLSIPGEHNAINALAAVAVGATFRVPGRKIRKALESFRPASKRMEVLNLEGVLVFNDTYNANPDSMIAALKTLASAAVSGKKIAVLADMREMGEAGREEHARIGMEIPQLGIDYLLTYGDLARYIQDAAQLANGVHYDQKNILAEYLAELIAPGDAVLLKGSRGMKMEDIVTFLKERLDSAVVPFG